MLSQDMVWAICLLLLAAVLLFLEFLVPSAGLLGIGAAIAAAAALFLAFSEGVTPGLVMSGIAAVAAPVLFGFAIKVWPYTPIGRRILNLPPPNEDGGLEGGNTGPWGVENPHAVLLGKVGVAVTNLLPAGRIEVEGRRYDAVAQGMAIDKGTAVEVASVDAGRIRVKATMRRPVEQFVAEQTKSTPASAKKEASALEKPLEDFDLGDLNDTLG